MADETLITLTADIVSAYVSNNRLTANEVAPAIQSVHGALAGLGTPQVAPVEEQKPAVSVRASIRPEYLVSLESGKKMKMLKRYLMTNYGMTPADYRAKWKLPADYPMVAPNYSESRKALARQIGLGRKAAAEPAKPAPKPKAKRAPRKAPAEA